MNSFIDSLLSMLSFTELPYSILVVIAILITGVHIFLLMALFIHSPIIFSIKPSIKASDKNFEIGHSNFLIIKIIGEFFLIIKWLVFLLEYAVGIL